MMLIFMNFCWVVDIVLYPEKFINAGDSTVSSATVMSTASLPNVYLMILFRKILPKMNLAISSTAGAELSELSSSEIYLAGDSMNW